MLLHPASYCFCILRMPVSRHIRHLRSLFGHSSLYKEQIHNFVTENDGDLGGDWERDR